MYFAQRQPQELGAFTWIIDGKEPTKKTNWEQWWSWYAQGALANMSIHRPAPRFEKGDYSFYNRFKKNGNDESQGIDLSLLLADIRFSSVVEPGLELVDIVVTATRRALVGNLGEAGYDGIHKLMIHRKGCYIQFMKLSSRTVHRSYVPFRPAYAQILRRCFSSGGRLMLAPRFLRAAKTEFDKPLNRLTDAPHRSHLHKKREYSA